MASPVATDEIKLTYDVFISFSGSDTRDNFTSHLHAALVRENIHAFIDTTFPRGQDIVPSLLKAIKESEVAVIIFSQSYGGSFYCLDELVKILEYRDQRKMVVLPVFYGVDPPDVGEQKGKFGEEFEKLKAQYMDEGDKLDKWVDALKKAANISGSVWTDFRPDARLIKEVVDLVLKNLQKFVPSLSPGLVGMELHIKEMLQLLNPEKMDVRFLGIWGLGGIGKTTCANALLNQIAGDFDSYYFQPNVREESRKHSSRFLQNEVIGKILNMKKTPNMLSDLHRKRLQRKKVLIIFDDVSSIEQLKTIVGRHDMYGPGSRIIITSRDKQVLENGVDVVYEIECLSDVEAFQLFRLHAFKSNRPDESYLNLSKKVVSYAGGVPLALMILGSLLYNKPLKVWESQLEKLRKIPEGRVMNVLKISYEELDDDDERNIFLDIACFFKGEDQDLVTDILKSCGFFSHVGISHLVDKCLITITDGKKLQMHDLVQEMGRDIVRQESKDCGKRSRLWEAKEILDVLTRNMGNESIQGIMLDNINNVERDLLNLPISFLSMPNLRILKISGGNFERHSNFSLPYLPSSLSYLHWENYPWRSLHDDFSPEKLVYLCLQYSKIERLWSKVSPQLKLIDLSHSNLKLLPDLSSAVNLEKIILDGCIKLLKIPTSIQNLSLCNLVYAERG